MFWASAAAFYHQLAVLTKAGLTLAQSLRQIAETGRGRHRRLAGGWAERCAGGSPLHEALAADGEAPFATALIAAGEISGRLPEMAATIAGFYEQAVAQRATLIARLAYPVIVIHFALMLPGLVRLITGAGGAWGTVAGPVMLWVVALAAWLVGRLAGRGGLLARLALLWPLRGLTLPFAAANTCDVVRAGLAAGLKVDRCLDLAAGACGNRVIGERLRATAAAVVRGTVPNLTAALAAAGMPRLVLDLVAAGEAGGATEDALARAAGGQRAVFDLRLQWSVRLAAGAIYAVAMVAAAVAAISMYAGYLAQVRTIADGIE